VYCHTDSPEGRALRGSPERLEPALWGSPALQLSAPNPASQAGKIQGDSCWNAGPKGGVLWSTTCDKGNRSSVVPARRTGWERCRFAPVGGCRSERWDGLRGLFPVIAERSAQRSLAATPQVVQAAGDICAGLRFLVSRWKLYRNENYSSVQHGLTSAQLRTSSA